MEIPTKSGCASVSIGKEKSSMANLHSVKSRRLSEVKHKHGDAVYVNDKKQIFVSVNGALVLLTDFFRRWPVEPVAPPKTVNRRSGSGSAKWITALDAKVLEAFRKRPTAKATDLIQYRLNRVRERAGDAHVSWTPAEMQAIQNYIGGGTVAELIAACVKE
jgi:hypothetical protein